MFNQHTISRRYIFITRLKLLTSVIAGCLVAFIIHCIQSVFLGNEAAHLSMLNPLISGYLHASPAHFITNMIFLFLVLLPTINHQYRFKSLFIITTVLSIIYLPVSLANLTQPAIGLSGTCFYLGARYLWSWNNFPRAGKAIIIILILAELSALLQPEDGVAHIMHVSGMLLGIASITIKSQKLYNAKIQFKLHEI